MFTNKTLQTTSVDGKNFILLEALVFVMGNGLTVRAPIGSGSDGVSTPRYVWTIIPPFGKTWFPGILHDAAYRNTLEMETHGGRWIPARFDRQQADELMLEALTAQGVDEVERQTIYRALREFGQVAFDEDRAAKP